MLIFIVTELSSAQIMLSVLLIAIQFLLMYTTICTFFSNAFTKTTEPALFRNKKIKATTKTNS